MEPIEARWRGNLKIGVRYSVSWFVMRNVSMPARGCTQSLTLHVEPIRPGSSRRSEARKGAAWVPVTTASSTDRAQRFCINRSILRHPRHRQDIFH